MGNNRERCDPQYKKTCSIEDRICLELDLLSVALSSFAFLFLLLVNSELSVSATHILEHIVVQISRVRWNVA